MSCQFNLSSQVKSSDLMSSRCINLKLCQVVSSCSSRSSSSYLRHGGRGEGPGEPTSRPPRTIPPAGLVIIPPPIFLAGGRARLLGSPPSTRIIPVTVSVTIASGPVHTAITATAAAPRQLIFIRGSHTVAVVTGTTGTDRARTRMGGEGGGGGPSRPSPVHPLARSEHTVNRAEGKTIGGGGVAVVVTVRVRGGICPVRVMSAGMGKGWRNAVFVSNKSQKLLLAGIVLVQQSVDFRDFFRAVF